MLSQIFDRARVYAEFRAIYVAVAQELRHDALGDVDGDGVALALSNL